ncbi:MAG: TatD family hydrolase [Gemmatimonadota bacterium]|nr:TatD family hydrolase [Gemmatimonadota bacterium]
MSRPVLFDSHLHLTSTRFDEDRDDVLVRARDAGVREMVTIASNPTDARAAIELARAEEGVWATAGLHPHEADATSDRVLEDIEALTAQPEVVAVGETGLDFFYDNAARETQIRNFRAHLDLARRTELPIVVHSREADQDTALLVQEYADSVMGVLHCFASGPELLRIGIEAGWYVSFSGLVTFVPALETAAREVPDSRVMIETDAPYLAPAPRRGGRNEPAFVAFSCERLAELRGVEPNEMARTTRRNARRFYGLGDPE